MNRNVLQEFILQSCGAESATPTETVQTLWSGYGEIIRYKLHGSEQPSVIVKYIAPPSQNKHPRGWNTDLGHQRKLKSYQIESNWYQSWAHLCHRHDHNHCRLPRCIGMTQLQGITIILLEDLDAAGFSARRTTLSQREVQSCLAWLANFHAHFMLEQPTGLWKVGTYWHLDTRPEEWAAMPEGPLKAAAGKIDESLSNARFKTIVHGDAKVANFCFSPTSNTVAAVDFQYVGGGCGMKDVAYFLGSCLSETECQQLEDLCLDEYFVQLRQALKRIGKDLDFNALEKEWRQLYPLAWADFCRFLQGWMPGHKKLHGYSAAMTDLALRLVNESAG